MKLQNKLLSESLKEKLKTIHKESKVANSLLKLNRFAYNKNYIRNLTIRKDGMFTYLPKHKECILSENNQFWKNQNRQSGKLGKIARQVILSNKEKLNNLEFIDKDFEEFNNMLKSSIESENETFKVIKGDDIAEIYSSPNFSDDLNIGTLKGSCMNDEPESYFDIYTQNPDVINMLILETNEGYLIGRALIWKLDSFTLLDRIYGNDITVQKFKDYAKEQGWWYKEYQSYDYKTEFINSDGEEECKNISVNLDTEFSYYPYIDTFTYGGYGYLQNYPDSSEYQYTNTSGERESNGVWDEVDECYINEDDAVWLDSLGGYTHLDNTIYDEIDDVSILEDDAVWLEDERMYTHRDNAIKLENGNYVTEENCFYSEYDNGYYHIDEYGYCDYSEQSFSTEENDYTHIEELNITVLDDYIEDAYSDNGYIQDEDGNWIKEEELKTV